MGSRVLRRAPIAVAAGMLIALQVASGVSAARPAGTATSASYGDFGGGGDAGFTASLAYTAKSTSSKVFLQVTITSGTDVPLLAVTRGAANVTKDCSIVASPLAIRCLFKTVRAGDVMTAVFSVRPRADASAVTAEAIWGTTGYVTGGNNSHGDAWEDGPKTAKRNPNTNYAGGFGNRVLATGGTIGTGNPQVAKLVDLPASTYSSVDDDAGATDSGFPLIAIKVNNGAPAMFKVLVTYGSSWPKPASYVHVSDGYPTTEYLPCVTGQPQVNCFTFDKSTKTATIYLQHNGSLRRTS